MKSVFLIFAVLFSCINIVYAQTKQVAVVASVVGQFRKAMLEADSVLLQKLTSPKLSYGHSGGHIDDQKEFVQKIVSGKSDFVTLEFAEQTISISKDVALVRHKFNAITNDNGKPGEVHLAVLLIWQKLHGDWKLLARQAIKTQ